jgi:hypothetical protein
MTFWPNPVRRNHAGEKRWYFNVAVREEGAKRVRLHRYRGEWYDTAGRLRESKEEPLDIQLAPRQHISYADLWVTSALERFHYRLIVYGRDEHGHEVSAEAVLVCQ